MSKANLNAAFLSISLDRTHRTSLQAQLTQELRRLVHDQKIVSGDRLPPSRVLAQELSVSRITVTSAYDQLISEGYLQGRRGSGMFVAPDLPDLPIQTPQTPQTPPQIAPTRHPIAFETAEPDISLFPFAEWSRLLDQSWRNPQMGLLRPVDPFGSMDLRSALAMHLRDWRGITCDPAQIVITSGLSEALTLFLKAALTPGDTVLVEDPGHAVLRHTIATTHMQLITRHVDADGLPIDPEGDSKEAIRAVAVTPSRHYPLGMTMPLARRLSLLNWAQNAGGYIIEDDYDGEYRYRGQPLPAMMSLDTQNRVIYVGSFSQVMFHSLRMGYMVLPAPLIDPVRHEIEQQRPTVSMIAQPALARFISEGGFATHIRRMRRIYAQRQNLLIDGLNAQAAHILHPRPSEAGLHIIADLSPDLPAGVNDIDLALAAQELGVGSRPLRQFYAGAPVQNGLVLGFARFDETQIRSAISRLSLLNFR